MKNKNLYLLIVLVVLSVLIQKCAVKTDPVLLDNGANDNNINPNSSDNPAYKFTFPGNNGFDLYTVGLGGGNMQIPSLYDSNFVALYGRCDFTQGYYVMAIVAGSAKTKEAFSNFIVYFKNKPTQTRDFKFAKSLETITDTTAYILFTDIKTVKKTWKSVTGKVNYNISNKVTFANVGGEDLENGSRPLISFTGSVNCK